ncbi:MAG: hypothetical protein E3J72_19530 [Planctomycetota bacterium]|nr:MAG: hypothetical protein E3J72_19530 [Planctomycetota bacterium]
MKTSFAITFRENGQLQIKIAGKLVGHAAREGLDFIKLASSRGMKNIRLDLRETTSVDSLGFAIFDWIRQQNGNLKISIAPPLKGLTDDELSSIAGVSKSRFSGSARDSLYESFERSTA